MRTIESSGAFKRDYKRLLSAPRHREDAPPLISAITALLVVDQPLPKNNRDHALSGAWTGFRECHVKPDLLLIYRKPDQGTLQMSRLGSHSDLFG